MDHRTPDVERAGTARPPSREPALPPLTDTEALMDAALGLSPGGLLHVRGAGGLALHRRDPRRFLLTTPWHEFSGDLSQGLLLQAVRGPDGQPGSPICHSGNIFEYRNRRRAVSLDVEDRIVDWGIRRLPGRVILFHESCLEGPFGLLSRPRRLGRLRYEYAVAADSPVLSVTVTLALEAGIHLEQPRVTTALDALSPSEGTHAVRRAIVHGFGGRRAIAPDGGATPLSVHAGPADAVDFPEEPEAGKTFEPLLCRLQLCDGHHLHSVRAVSRGDGALHWCVLRYGASRLGPGGRLVVREERLRGPEGLAEPLTEAAPDALRLLAPGAAPAGTGDSAGFRGPGGLVAPVAAAAGARPPPVFLGDRLLTYTHRGARIYAVPTDRNLTPWLIERGEWEPHVERALRQLVRPGMCAADVGANVGYHTLTLAEIVGEDGRVFAFEADPFLAELVESTAAANGFAPRVHVAAKAVLDAPGEVVLAAASGHPGGGYVIRPQAAPAAPPARDRHLLHSIVPAVTLDSALAEVPALDLLRMDIEGAEPLALRGAAGLIDRSPHLAIVMEWSVAMMSRLADPGEAAAWLAARGFRFWRITGAPARNFETVPVAELTALPHCDLLAARQDPG